MSKNSNVSNQKNDFSTKKKRSRMKSKILHRSRTIKRPMKNPAPRKILEKKSGNLKFEDLALLNIIYLQSLENSNFSKSHL